MLIGILSALLASSFWTISCSFWSTLSTPLSALQINCLKNTIALFFFLPFIVGFPLGTELNGVLFLLLSGAIGIAIGDSLYIAALRRLGTRRTLTVESLAPLIAFLTDVSLMGKHIPLSVFVGALLVGSSLIIIAFQSPPYAAQLARRNLSTQKTGFLFAFLGVLCGVFGAFLSRLVLVSSEITPLESSTFRLIGGVFTLIILFWSKRKHLLLPEFKKYDWIKIVIATFIGTNLGIALQQVVFKNLSLGIGITLLSLSPLFALFLREGDVFKISSLFASSFAVIGIWLVFTY